MASCSLTIGLVRLGFEYETQLKRSTATLLLSVALVKGSGIAYLQGTLMKIILP